MLTTETYSGLFSVRNNIRHNNHRRHFTMTMKQNLCLCGFVMWLHINLPHSHSNQHRSRRTQRQRIYNDEAPRPSCCVRLIYQCEYARIRSPPTDATIASSSSTPQCFVVTRNSQSHTTHTRAHTQTALRQCRRHRRPPPCATHIV